MENMIDVTDADVVELVKAAYDLSHPVGLGHLHHNPEPLTDAEAQSLIYPNNRLGVIVNMDYVNGRCCKFSVIQKDDRQYIYAKWFDHTDEDLNRLLTKVGVHRD